MDKCIFNCEVCGESRAAENKESEIPECCGKPMAKQEPLPVCEISSTAEHSRFDDLGEPCDDGRSGLGVKDDD